MTVIGQWEEFTWAEGEWNCGTLVSAFPKLVLGNRVVITAFDSGPLNPTEEERALGWETREGCAISPVVADPSHLPVGEYDEWWVFATEPSVLPSAEDPFVNYERFSLCAPEKAVPHLDHTHCRLAVDSDRAYLLELQQRFQAELRRVRPESFLCDWLVVSRDPGVSKWIRNL